ncbi:hypothetical protein AAHB53_19065 [Niallia circulans]
MKMKKKVPFLLVLMLLIGTVLAGCSLKGNSTADNSSKDGVTTLLMYQIGDKPENFDTLMENVNKKTEKEIGVRVNLQYIGWGDYEKKCPLSYPLVKIMILPMPITM